MIQNVDVYAEPQQPAGATTATAALPATTARMCVPAGVASRVSDLLAAREAAERPHQVADTEASGSSRQRTDAGNAPPAPLLSSEGADGPAESADGPAEPADIYNDITNHKDTHNHVEAMSDLIIPDLAALVAEHFNDLSLTSPDKSDGGM